MKYNTKQVKKNFLKERLIGILVILILTLTMVPCFTSCSHGNNPEKSKPEVEDKNKKPDTPNPPKPTEETPEQKIARILGSFAIEKSGAIPTIPDGMSSEVLEEQYAPLGLAYKEGDKSGKVYLLAKNGYVAGTITNKAAIIESLSSLKAEISKTTGNPYSECPKPEAVINFPAAVGDVLEWRWQNLIHNTNDYISSTESTLWFKFLKGIIIDGGPIGKPYSMYRFMHTSFYFAVKSGNDPEVYFYNSAGVARYIDWEITLVERSNRSKGYSFHVGPYSVKIKGMDNTDPKKPKPVEFPPVDDGKLSDKYDEDYIHMLKLSTLIRLSLEKKLTDAGISADVAKQAVENYLNNEGKIFTNFNTWDIYLTPYRIMEGPNKEATPLGDRIYHAYGVWRNTFKLNHLDTEGSEFWKRCWQP